jgi:hypothetical protein
LLFVLLCVLVCWWVVGVGSALAVLPAQFGEEGEGAGEFFEPSGVAVDQESRQVFLVDKNNARVERWSGEGAFEVAWGRGVNRSTHGDVCLAGEECVAGAEGAAAGEFGNAPSGVAVDGSLGFSHGDVYVVDRSNRRVEKFSPDGEFLLMFGKGVNKVTGEDVCRAAEVADCGAGEEAPGPGGFAVFESQAGIAVDASGSVLVGERERVEKFSEDGVFEEQLSLPGAEIVTQLALDPAGDLYVVATGLAGVHEYTPAGVEVGEPRDRAASQFGTVIATGPAGELFVYDSGQGHVQEFDSSGAQVSSFVQEGGSGGIAFADALGVLYVLHRSSVSVVSPPPPGPVVFGEHVDEVQPTSAVAHAVVNPEGAPTDYHVEFGTTTAFGQSTPLSAPLTAVNEVQAVTVKASGGHFTLAFEGEVSEAIPFDASAAVVQARLEGLVKLGAGQVAVSGEAAGPWSIEFTGRRGGQDVPEFAADGSELEGEEHSATVTTTTAGISLFDDRAAAATLEGLQPDTVYHYRFVASDGTHTTLGEDATFRTAPAVSIEDETVSHVTGESARLEAVLDAHGLPSEFHFDYGTSTSYDKHAPVPDASAGKATSGVPFGVLVEGLSPDTTYHFRVVAHNALGETIGPDQTFTTRGTKPTGLLDGRGWEQVSPPDKHAVALLPISAAGGELQAADNGDAITYVAVAPVSEETDGNRNETQLLSTRTSSGWKTADITTPHTEIVGAVAGGSSEYKLFSGDLSVGLVEPFGATVLAPGLMGPDGERTPYRREQDGSFTPLVTASNTPAGTRFGGEESEPGRFVGGVQFAAMSPDAAHVVLTSSQPLTGGFSSEGHQSVFEWSGGHLALVSILPPPDDKPAAEAGLEADVGAGSQQVRGAVSTDGSRVVFETSNGSERHLFVRDVVRGESVRLDVPAAGVRVEPGQPVFQAASADGSRVLFTDGQRLTADATAKEGRADLYLCRVSVVAGKLACALEDLTVDRGNEAAAVQGDVLGVGDAGRFVYFVANGALPGVAGAVQGDCEDAPNPWETAESSVCNLYVRDVDAGVTRLVAVVANRDAPDWRAHGGSGLGEMTSRVSPGGRWLAFMSSRSLTGFDNRDAVSGVRDAELFLFDRAAGSLVCVSCDRSGARPVGVFDPPARGGGPAPLLVDRQENWQEQWLAGSVPGWTNVDLTRALYQSRYLSDSGRLFFDSPVGLVVGDVNGLEDVYEFEPAGVGGCGVVSGCVGLLSGGVSDQESAFVDASSSGDDVFFLTAARLASSDVDSALDVYDAHVCSSAAPCAGGGVVVSPPACSTADSCRAAPAGQPDVFGAPASSTFSGPGSSAPAGAVKAPVRRLTRAQKLARALAACRKKRHPRERARCRRLAQRRYGHASSRGLAQRRYGRAGGRGGVR